MLAGEVAKDPTVGLAAPRAFPSGRRDLFSFERERFSQPTTTSLKTRQGITTMAAVTPHRPSATGEAPPATPITDFSAIESQKENIQPLSTGRSAHALSTIFAARPKQLEREFREGRERFEEELREVEERRRSELTGEDTSRFSEEQADPLDVFER